MRKCVHHFFEREWFDRKGHLTWYVKEIAASVGFRKWWVVNIC
jgi:hypothetical protein